MKITAKRPRTVAAITAAAVAAALALSGCSAGGGSSNSGSSKELTVWHYFSDPNQVKLMTDYASLFQKNNPGVKVNNVYVPYDQMDSKLIASAGAKSGPDVVVFNGADTDNLALANTLAPIDSQWNGFADKDQFPASVVHKVNGKTYSVQGYVNLLGLWYNKDILDKIGVKPPTTLDELNTALGKAVAAGYQGITLCGLPQSQGEWQAYPWLTAAGFNYANPSTTDLAKGLTTAQNWVGKGYVSKEATTWDQTVPFQKFAAGNVAFAENGNWQIGTAKTTAKFTYGVVPLPVGSSGKVYLGGEGEGIGKYSKNPSLAWKYLQETYFDKSAQLIALKDVGSIPSRKDSASNSAVSSNPLIAPFADSIAKNGAVYPDDAVQPKSVNDLQLAVGQAWSSVLGGQSSPKDAATSLVSKIQPYLNK
ncbi:MAG: multiple sugar transport system substrate-binding protein [Microbacteriaceae bacterium]|nr:multiple sugar transport system substrate-binding protein [Microbacteriaceae bacterium]